MMITYDETKRSTNIAKHGFDFTDLDVEFFYASTVIPSRDGRSMAIGAFGDDIISVVFKYLGSEGISIISMRPASRKERSILP